MHARSYNPLILKLFNAPSPIFTTIQPDIDQFLFAPPKINFFLCNLLVVEGMQQVTIQKIQTSSTCLRSHAAILSLLSFCYKVLYKDIPSKYNDVIIIGNYRLSGCYSVVSNKSTRVRYLR